MNPYNSRAPEPGYSEMGREGLIGAFVQSLFQKVGYIYISIDAVGKVSKNRLEYRVELFYIVVLYASRQRIRSSRHAQRQFHAAEPRQTRARLSVYLSKQFH